MRQLFRMRQLLRRLSGARHLQARPGPPLRVDTTLCTGCAVCVEQCPCHAMEMIPEPPRRRDGLIGEPAIAGRNSRFVPDSRRARRARDMTPKASWTATPPPPISPIVSTRCARSSRSLRHRRWPSWPTHWAAEGLKNIWGERPGGAADAERGRGRGRRPRRAAKRRADHDLHRLAGVPADAAQHVQDRRGADPDACSMSRRGRSRLRRCRSSATIPT